ncbi:MAG: DUF1284 domain-containing protein [Prolixibacteraceae bacterium]|jgi:hypothetical protein|nr:DUF1284 domain-containing protein [Prolixibacteraceae bacterium]MBT6006757.1 DUF1284 domain-containing protein [Prolixibacteraceae bacterium]MBT6766628.1 DUF1284 domain-containing protein [Prolixibacteraceae bacterium]MBT6997628.1 DUF1284 domain-containing protein [Prolixibacteraceae bacterium]MBT7394935.1 DUF1284 domain-containing protein [Prolixibacteraceae bacterium]
MKIRIHHFFDIIRDFGSNKNITPHPYLHSYHKVAQEIRENANTELTIVVESDEVCKNCIHLKNSNCDDTISHRNDFSGKEKFNNYLDKRIVEICGIKTSIKYSPKTLCDFANKYIKNIEYIYKGNDKKHTQFRKDNVLKGLKYYSQKHDFKISVRN